MLLFHTDAVYLLVLKLQLTSALSCTGIFYMIQLMSLDVEVNGTQP